MLLMNEVRVITANRSYEAIYESREFWISYNFNDSYQKFRSLYWYALICAWKRKVHRLRPYVSFLLQIPYKRTTESFWSLVLGNLGESHFLHALKYAQVDHIVPKFGFRHNFARLFTCCIRIMNFDKFKNFHFLPEVKVGQFWLPGDSKSANIDINEFTRVNYII